MVSIAFRFSSLVAPALLARKHPLGLQMTQRSGSSKLRPVSLPLMAGAFALLALPADAQEWEFSVTPYFWASGLEGKIRAFPNLPPVNVDLSFSDVFDQLDGAVMIKGEAQRGRLGLIADVAYVKTAATTKNITILDPRYTGVALKNELTTATFAAAWRAVDEERYSIDFLGGVRYSRVAPDLSLIFRDRVVQQASPDDSWFDPVIGARTTVELGPRWSLTAYGDVGGFGVSSDLTFQGYAAANFALSDRWALSAGWRHYAIDHESDGFVYDVSQDGPLLGVTFSW